METEANTPPPTSTIPTKPPAEGQHDTVVSIHADIIRTRMASRMQRLDIEKLKFFADGKEVTGRGFLPAISTRGLKVTTVAKNGQPAE